MTEHGADRSAQTHLEQGIDAVVFDLFGTLVPPFSTLGYSAVTREMATVCGVSADSFEEAWIAAYPERDIGAATPADQLVTICSHLGCDIEESIVEKAMDLRIAFFQRTLQPRPETVDVLRSLREGGLKVGLVSDCSSEAPLVWPTTPMASLVDAAVFSCQAGCHKPDPKIYALVTEALGAMPSRCIYVGDGGSSELSGAERVGMTPVLLKIPDEQDPERYLVLGRETWMGRTISCLEEVLTLANEVSVEHSG